MIRPSTFAPFCVPVPTGVDIVGDRILVEGVWVCTPGADLPEIDLTPPGPDLMPEDLPQGDADVQTPADTDAATDSGVEAVPEPCTEDCPSCAPHTDGVRGPEYYSSLRPAHRNGYRYQHFVNESFGIGQYFPITEAGAGSSILIWNWQGQRFDGLVFGQCKLLEAKYGYANFLEGGFADVPPRLRDWARATEAAGNMVIFLDMVADAEEFQALVDANRPWVSMQWCFSEVLTKLYVTNLFNAAGLVDNWTMHLPYEAT